LQPFVADENVHPIANLQAPNEREDFVGRQIDRMQREPEVIVLATREEANGAVPGPFDQEGFARAGDRCLDKPRPLA
jgi:hypothetical protein